MANQEHAAILKQGTEFWNQWRKECPEKQPDLQELDLSGLRLRGVNLRSANLGEARLREADLRSACLDGANLRLADARGANLRGATLRSATLNRSFLSAADLSTAILAGASLYMANLSKADLSGTDLSSADLSYADLLRADLNRANLNGADLRGVNLISTDLNGASLSNADFRGAIAGRTIFAHLDLRLARGLAEITHLGPSHIELHTIRLPQDGNEISFLRGTGIPDEWIDSYRAQMQSLASYYSCFISHSSKDEALAHHLYADLQDHDVRCWFAPHDMKIGDRLRQSIDRAIHQQEKLLLLLSEHSIYSDWVEDEVETALEKERCQQGDVLFPIRLDNAVLHTNRPWAAKIRRTRHIGDFTNWTNLKAYQQAFEQLLHDLKKAST